MTQFNDPQPGSTPAPQYSDPQQQFGGSAQYGAQPGYAGAEQPKILSILALVGGIAGLTILPFVGSIAGIVLAILGKKREPAGRTFATWGLWLSIVGLVLWVIITIAVVAFSFWAAQQAVQYGY